MAFPSEYLNHHLIESESLEISLSYPTIQVFSSKLATAQVSPFLDATVRCRLQSVRVRCRWHKPSGFAAPVAA